MNIHEVLYKYYGYKTFRPGQEEVIKHVLNKEDCIARLPTGTGKSLCYMLPGYLIDGLVIVISPLLSLMEDQVLRIKANGEKRVVALNSLRTYEERIYIYNNIHKLKYLYISPEMLQNEMLVQKLKENKIAYVAIDEAHCISKWGHDFRTDYLKIKDVLSFFKQVTILSLTATATEEVLLDIAIQLGMKNPKQVIYSVNRPNIGIVVEKFNDEIEKKHRFMEVIQKLPKPLIVYCSSRAMTEILYEELKLSGMKRVEYYHGGVDRESRILLQEQFLVGQIDTFICTSAFGMGVHKDNIRTIIHYHFPSQLESYIQEIGRAGRDGNQSIALLLVAPSDFNIPRHLIEQEFPSDESVKQYVYKRLSTDSSIGQQDFENEKMLNYYLSKIQRKYHTGEIEKDFQLIGNEIYTEIEERKVKRLGELEDMIAWLHSNKCRRENYLRFFDEKLEVENTCCCDICGLVADDFFENARIYEENKSDWRFKLFQLISMEGESDVFRKR